MCRVVPAALALLSFTPLEAKKTSSPLYGIDVSRHQLVIDWPDVAIPLDRAGVYTDISDSVKSNARPAFVFIKATEGSDLQDVNYTANLAGARKRGMVCGAYHYLSTLSPVGTQVLNFIARADLRRGDLPPILDVELPASVMQTKGDEVCEMALQWLKSIEEYYGVRPLIYTYNKFIADYFSDPRFEDYEFIIARYGAEPDVRDWVIWQFTDQAHIPGIPGAAVDLDRWHGSEKEFKSWLKKHGIRKVPKNRKLPENNGKEN